jgi:hypothetical protein
VYPVISVATSTADVLKVLGRNIRSPAAVRSRPYAGRNSEEQRWTSNSFIGVPAKFRTVHLWLPQLQNAESSVALCLKSDGVHWVDCSYERSEWTAILRHSTDGVQLSRDSGLSVRPSVRSASQSSRPSGGPVSSTVTCRYAARNTAWLRATTAASWSGRLVVQHCRIMRWSSELRASP